MPAEIVFLRMMEMLLPTIAIVALGFPIIRIIARRFERRDAASPASLAKIDERLSRLEAGIDSIAIEVERISEGQRFTAKLLAERAGSPGSR
ncbi:MAG TPA: hypothetical protein VFB46_12095 [Gemmatimonadaceae bacterium]|nr:hypothetical protein [Gemmatimonadaceae bacterium]